MYMGIDTCTSAVKAVVIDEVCTPPPILHVVEPDDRMSDLYSQRIGRFRNLYRHLKDSFVETPS